MGELKSRNVRLDGPRLGSKTDPDCGFLLLEKCILFQDYFPYPFHKLGNTVMKASFPYPPFQKLGNTEIKAFNFGNNCNLLLGIFKIKNNSRLIIARSRSRAGAGAVSASTVAWYRVATLIFATFYEVT
jgi:hypothetical protein